MPTEEEIDRRITETDAPRSARRSAAAKRISELAQHHATLARQVNDTEGQLGDALVGAQDVIGVDELAEFTEIPAADLARWLTARTTAKAPRTRRKRSTATIADRPAPDEQARQLVQAVS